MNVKHKSNKNMCLLQHKNSNKFELWLERYYNCVFKNEWWDWSADFAE